MKTIKELENSVVSGTATLEEACEYDALCVFKNFYNTHMNEYEKLGYTEKEKQVQLLKDGFNEIGGTQAYEILRAYILTA